MMQKASRKAQNFLDFVPAGNPAFSWELQEDGTVAVTMPHNGLFDRLAQRFFRRPRYSRICLDELGSFIWMQIDGKRSIHEISSLVRQQFGERAEPLISRLVAFFRVLESHRFVRFGAEGSRDPARLCSHRHLQKSDAPMQKAQSPSEPVSQPTTD